jgi:hypothetical protein
LLAPDGPWAENGSKGVCDRFLSRTLAASPPRSTHSLPAGTGPASDAYRLSRPPGLWRLDVLPRDVVDTADGWPAAERAVWSALVVVAEPV